MVSVRIMPNQICLEMAHVCSGWLRHAFVFIGCNLAAWYLILPLIWGFGQRHSEKTDKAWAFREISVPDVHCSRLVSGDLNEGRTNRLNRRAANHRITDMIKETKDISSCASYKQKRSYIDHHLTTEERDFPIAFSVIVYKDLNQVERLLRAIYRPQNFYCIHVDLKASWHFREALLSLSGCFNNVFLAQGSINVRWGKLSVLQAELICMEELLRYKWKYVINLTGQEFPLKTNRQIVRYLKGLNGSNDIKGSLKRRNIHRTLSLEPAPHGLVLTKGPVHIAAVRGFAEFVTTNSRAIDFLTWLNGTVIPDETYFSTLNHNPALTVPGAFNGSWEDMEARPSLVRYKLWYPAVCRGRWQRGICVFGTLDLPYIVVAPQLFANKFEQDFDQVAYDCLEEWHRNTTRDEYLKGG